MSKPTYQQIHIDVALTNISLAYTPGDYIADQVFPVVPVNTISNKYFIYTKADWMRNDVGLRAPGARAYRADFGITQSSLYICKERAIAKQVPDEITDNADNPLRPLEDATRWATEQIMQKRELEVAGCAFGGSWSTSATPALLWSNPTSTPIDDVETAVTNVVQQIGKLPNTGIIGRGAYRFLKNHPDIVERIKFTSSPTDPAAVGIAALSALFGLNTILVGVAVQDTSLEGVASSQNFIWGNHMLVEYVPNAPSLLTPAAGYIFAYKQREISRFREEQERADVVEARMSFDTQVIASDAGYFLKSVA